MKSLRCEFIVSPLNHNLSYCKYCNRVISNKDNTNLFNNTLCPIKLHDAALDPNDDTVKIVKEEVIERKNPDPVEQKSQSKKECSQETIDQRLSICKSCPFYENDTCLQCGCALSRDRNYKNKLYFADQSCPIGKWGPAS